MNARIASLIGPLVLALIPGSLLAQTPSAGAVPPAAAAPAATAPATAAAPAAATAAPASAKPVANPEEMQAVRKTASGLGLKPRQKGGIEVYCKSSADIGTRLATEHCYTRQELAVLQKMAEINQKEATDMQRASLTVPPAIEPTTNSTR